MTKSVKSKQTKGKRESIIASAFELFFTKGYKNTKIIEIAQASNIGKGTFYEYFESKEALLLELLNAKFEFDRQNTELIGQSDLTGTEKIKSFFRFEIDCMKKYGPTSNALAQEMMTPGFTPSEEIASILHKAFATKYAFINQVIIEGIKSKEFKEIDTTLASTGILGAISFYTAFKFNIINHNIIPGLPFENVDWDNEDFFQLIFTGLK